MALDALTVERIKLIHPTYRDKALEVYTHANEKLLPVGVRLRFTHTLRTIAEQNVLYAQGRTTKGSILTNAKGGQSLHNYGLAFDIVILFDKDNNGTFETANYNVKDQYFIRVKDYFKSQGLSWGGDFTNFFDGPHFQWETGYTTAQLLTKIKKGNTYPTL